MYVYVGMTAPSIGPSQTVSPLAFAIGLLFWEIKVSLVAVVASLLSTVAVLRWFDRQHFVGALRSEACTSGLSLRDRSGDH